MINWRDEVKLVALEVLHRFHVVPASGERDAHAELLTNGQHVLREVGERRHRHATEADIHGRRAGREPLQQRGGRSSLAHPRAHRLRQAQVPRCHRLWRCVLRMGDEVLAPKLQRRHVQLRGARDDGARESRQA